MAISDGAVEIPALGRPFQLGMLYDCRKDALIPGVTLWDPDSLRKDLSIQRQPKTEIEIIASDSIEDKTSALNASASLRAFFVFDREVSSSESVKEIEAELRGAIQLFIVSAEGKLAFKTTERERNYTQKFRCKFHGDFVLERNPVTFQDAMQTYAILPAMLGKDGERAVPVTVWLYPLTKLDSQAAKMVREISLALVFDSQAIMEQLNEIRMRCNDLTNTRIANIFPEIKMKIKRFKDLCKQHRQTFQKHLAGILPSIRGGGKMEQALVEIFISINQSPFNSQRLNEFLDAKEREINLVNSYLNILHGMEVISSKNKLEEIVLSPANEFVLTFTFSSLHDEEPFLTSLQQWLQKPARGQTEHWKAWFEQRERTRKARKTAKSLMDFAQVNESNGKIRFLVASVLDQDNPGASIYLYEDGEMVNSNFELPSKPLPPLVGRIGHDHVQLTFQPAEYGRASISSYQVEYKTAGEGNWEIVSTDNSQETFHVKGLRPDSEYQFRYTARSKPGLSETSDLSRSVQTLPTSPPGKPRERTVESSKISLVWESPKVIGADIKEYKVEYRGLVGDKDKWNEKRTGARTESCQLDGLKPHRTYRLRVSAVCFDGAESEPSEETEISTAMEQEEDGANILARKYLQESTLVDDGQPSVYVLPLEATSDRSAPIQTYQLGKENMQVPNKVIVMMGATGSGKTTLVNAMINHILGVQWEDDFRFKLIQAESQSSEVTAYVVHHQKGLEVPYSLTFIDTPGFGDMEGRKKYKQITKQIREFFSTPGGTDHVDVICIVLQASSAALTRAQKYVFDSVLSIFGTDIRNNIQILITFADGHSLPVLEAMKKEDVPCIKDSSGSPVHFKFNNSALFANNSEENEGNLNPNDKFWKMSTASMKTFFDTLSLLDSESLTLSKEVLRERKELEAITEGLQPQIRAALGKLEELRKTRQALDEHKSEMAANINFEFEVEKSVPRKEDISAAGRFTTNCMNCHYTCHYPCPIRRDEGKRRCVAINANTGKCNVCPGRCVWNMHFNQKYLFEYKVTKEIKSYGELKQKYEDASGEAMTPEKVLGNLNQEYKEAKQALEDLIQKSSQSLQRLHQIGLKPNPLSTQEYIDLLIISEEQDLEPGCQERIQLLKEVRESAELRENIASKEPLLLEEEDLYKDSEMERHSALKARFRKFVCF
ncbi:Stonustoxin subunit alpha [Podarcis lilfordi]|uniref:Stonustoxin subunit alpha n=1 Tax=Podarcis lilfordi TaxID=74358 RepID=A0AA35PII4_9SAUR|nr:Stonustoxin subunit alpha [Podarcis lilfordi]